MSDRPEFVGELRDQLTKAQPRLTQRRRRSQRLAAGAATLAVVGAIAFFWTSGPAVDSTDVVAVGAEERLAPTPTEATNFGGPAASAPIPTASPITTVPATSAITGDEAWTELDSSLPGEIQPGVFWTGAEVIVLATMNGGEDVTGERWNPATNQTTRIAPSGLSWRWRPAQVWTGTEVLVAGGSSGPPLSPVGAAYNPASDSWRPMADPPGDINGGENLLQGPAVWTGSEMIIWQAALAYAPGTDSWRAIASAPLSDRFEALTLWTGSELIVWGGCWNGGGHCGEIDSELLADGAMYDPATDAWTQLPPAPLPPAVAVVAGWSGSEIILVPTDADVEAQPAAAFNPASLVWRALSPAPLSPRRSAAGVWAEDRFVIWGGGTGTSDSGANDGASYDPFADQWTMLPAGPGPGRSLHTMAATESGIYISATQTRTRPLFVRLPPVDPRAAASVPEVKGEVGPDPCVAVLATPDSQGFPVIQVWPDRFRDGFSFDQRGMRYALIEDRPREPGVLPPNDWYLVGAIVHDLAERPLGLGVWINRVGESGDQYASYNDLARRATTWRSFDVESLEFDPIEVIRSCGGALPEPVPFISGQLLGGDAWVLTDVPGRGLCLAQSGVDYGCDNPRFDGPPESMRIAGTYDPAPGIAENNAGDLAYGYLPANAVTVALVLPDGTTYATTPVLDPQSGLWAAPIEPGNNPNLVRYLDADGQEVGIFLLDD